jgi:hypothetical protein
VWREAIHTQGSVERHRAALARLIAEDHDPAEVSYYETYSDPAVRSLNSYQLSYVGQYGRRLRRLRERLRHEGKGTRAK